MASNLHFSTALRNAMLQKIADAVDGGSGPGTIELRDGTQPANAAAAATGTVLVTFTCADPSFGSPASGVITADTSPVLSANAVASGTPTWARVKDSTGAVVFDGSVGTSAADFIVSSTPISSGQLVTLSAGTFTLPA
jgi:hypothetical protein